MSTSTSIQQVADLISAVDEKRLVLRPAFQRRLVWTNTAKENLIDTVRQGYPFPEIFTATGTLDLETTKRTIWLVDGQQRITTLRDYVKGSDDLRYKEVPRFKDLPPAERATFLEYSVAVRDLGAVTPERLKEIFRRINSTDFALKGMEVLNALYSGALNGFCEELSRHSFFEDHRVFSAAVRRRMYDVTFCVILVGTLLGGYYRRDERNEEFLERYNDEFPQAAELKAGLERVFDLIEKCNFDKKSRVWKQTDLFTVLVELYTAMVEQKKLIAAEEVGPRLSQFFDLVDAAYKTKGTATDPTALRYLKAATKATNDKYARQERATIIYTLITGQAPEDGLPASPAAARARGMPKNSERKAPPPKKKKRKNAQR